MRGVNGVLPIGRLAPPGSHPENAAPPGEAQVAIKAALGLHGRCVTDLQQATSSMLLHGTRSDRLGRHIAHFRNDRQPALSLRLLSLRSSHLLASGSKTAAQPQMQARAPLRASPLGAFQQTPAEDPEITDRLLTIESGASG